MRKRIPFAGVLALTGLETAATSQARPPESRFRQIIATRKIS
jgi:hypothetical protein